MKGSRFYFSQQDDGEKNLYRRIFEALNRSEPALAIHAGMGREFTVDIQKVLNWVLLDNPGLFGLNRHNITVKQTPLYIQLCFRYDYSPAEVEKLTQDLRQKIVGFMCGYLETGMSPAAKQLAVHKYLQNTVRPQKGEPDRDSFSVIGALLRGSCVCEGFAKAYKLLCDYLRLASIVVTGTVSGAVTDIVSGAVTGMVNSNRAGTASAPAAEALTAAAASATKPAVSAPVPHAWNITRINGVTAHTDMTWDAGIGPGGYDYFNLCDADIAADHRFDANLYPPCAPNKINYFYLNNLIAADLNEAKRIVAVNRGKKYFSLKLHFPITCEQLHGLGFPAGKLRFNETQNVVMFSDEQAKVRKS